MIFGQWIIIDHHTLPMLRPKRLLQESTYASQDMLLWNLAANVSTYTRILMDIWAVRETTQCFVRSWGMQQLCIEFVTWRFTKSWKMKLIPNVTTGLPANVFLTVRDEGVLSLCQWKMYNTDQWGPDGNFILSCGVICLSDSFWFNIIAIGKCYGNVMWSCTVCTANQGRIHHWQGQVPTLPIIINVQIVYPMFDIDPAVCC